MVNYPVALITLIPPSPAPRFGGYCFFSYLVPLNPAQDAIPAIILPCMYRFRICLYDSENKIFSQTDIEGATPEEFFIALINKCTSKRFRQHYNKKVNVTCHVTIPLRARQAPGPRKKISLCPQRCLEFKLAKREKEVLEGLAEGKKKKEVAGDLFISPYTIKTHVQNVFVKLGVNCLTEALNKLSA
jgi:DNA-binding CsgD family transcriptional regulator